MPTYSFDASNPLDASLISAYPANARAMRTALNSWATLEHALTGRHKLPSGTTAARNALADKLTGMWFYNTDTYEIEIWNGSAWATHGALIRPGFMQVSAYTTVPGGWLSCNGASLLRASYADLFAAIGTTYGTADGTHFNVPDMRGAVPAGWWSGGDGDSEYGTLGVQYGEKTGLIDATNIPLLTVTDPGHTHLMNQQSGYQSGGASVAIQNGTGGSTATGSNTTGITVGDAAPVAVDKRQLSLVVAWIIKA
jgi:microcystin-dependent protein